MAQYERLIPGLPGLGWLTTQRLRSKQTWHVSLYTQKVPHHLAACMTCIPHKPGSSSSLGAQGVRQLQANPCPARQAPG